MFMLLHTLSLAIIVTKSSSVWIVCKDKWPIFMKMGSPWPVYEDQTEAQYKSGHSCMSKGAGLF